MDDVLGPRQPTAALQCLDCSQSGGGMRKEWRRRVRPVLLDCHGAAGEFEYHLLPAKDLKLFKPKDHAERSQRDTELKRSLTLTALLQKLNADR